MTDDPNAPTTKEAYLKKLQDHYDASLKHGGNRAIKNHIDKIKPMDDAQFQAHHAELRARLNRPTVKEFARKAADFAFRKKEED